MAALSSIVPSSLVSAVSVLLQKLGFAPNRRWLEAELAKSDYAGSRAAPGSDASARTAAAAVMMAALYEDLSECGMPCLPSGVALARAHGSRLAGPLVLQLCEAVNVGAGAAEDVAAAAAEGLSAAGGIRGSGGGGGGGVATAGKRRLLKFALSDGKTLVPAVELVPILELSATTLAGCKLVVREVLVRRSLLLLRPENVRVLGGGVAELVAMQRFVAEQVRDKRKPEDEATRLLKRSEQSAPLAPYSATAPTHVPAASTEAAAAAALDGVDFEDIFSQVEPPAEVSTEAAVAADANSGVENMHATAQFSPPPLADIDPSQLAAGRHRRDSSRNHSDVVHKSAVLPSRMVLDGVDACIIPEDNGDDDDGIAPLDLGIDDAAAGLQSDSPVIPGEDEALFSSQRIVSAATKKEVATLTSAPSAASAAAAVDEEVLILDDCDMNSEAAAAAAALSPAVTVRARRPRGSGASPTAPASNIGARVASSAAAAAAAAAASTASSSYTAAAAAATAAAAAAAAVAAPAPAPVSARLWTFAELSAFACGTDEPPRDPFVAVLACGKLKLGSAPPCFLAPLAPASYSGGAEAAAKSSSSATSLPAAGAKADGKAVIFARVDEAWADRQTGMRTMSLIGGPAPVRSEEEKAAARGAIERLHRVLVSPRAFFRLQWHADTRHLRLLGVERDETENLHM